MGCRKTLKSGDQLFRMELFSQSCNRKACALLKEPERRLTKSAAFNFRKTQSA